mgnify:CR=1 FL=1
MAASVDVLSRASRAKANASALVAAGAWHGTPSPLCQQTRNCGVGSGPRPSDHAGRVASEDDARRARACCLFAPWCRAELWAWREASAGVATVFPASWDAWGVCCRAPGMVGMVGATGVAEEIGDIGGTGATGKKGDGWRLEKAGCMGPPGSGVGERFAHNVRKNQQAALRGTVTAIEPCGARGGGSPGEAGRQTGVCLEGPGPEGIRVQDQGHQPASTSSGQGVNVAGTMSPGACVWGHASGGMRLGQRVGVADLGGCAVLGSRRRCYRSLPAQITRPMTSQGRVSSRGSISMS